VESKNFVGEIDGIFEKIFLFKNIFYKIYIGFFKKFYKFTLFLARIFPSLVKLTISSFESTIISTSSTKF